MYIQEPPLEHKPTMALTKCKPRQTLMLQQEPLMLLPTYLELLFGCSVEDKMILTTIGCKIPISCSSKAMEEMSPWSSAKLVGMALMKILMHQARLICSSSYMRILKDQESIMTQTSSQELMLMIGIRTVISKDLTKASSSPMRIGSNLPWQDMVMCSIQRHALDQTNNVSLPSACTDVA